MMIIMHVSVQTLQKKPHILLKHPNICNIFRTLIMLQQQQFVICVKVCRGDQNIDILGLLHIQVPFS